jgi:hypothetical protein
MGGATSLSTSPRICEVYGRVGTSTADGTGGERSICLFAPRGSVLASDVGDGAGADGRSSFGGVGAAYCAELNYEVELEATVDASGGRYVLEPLFKVCGNSVATLFSRPGLPVRQPLAIVHVVILASARSQLPTKSENLGGQSYAQTRSISQESSHYHISLSIYSYWVL